MSEPSVTPVPMPERRMGRQRLPLDRTTTLPGDAPSHQTRTLHMRADSSGSVRNAFWHSADVAAPPNQKRHSRQPPPQQQPPQAHQYYQGARDGPPLHRNATATSPAQPQPLMAHSSTNFYGSDKATGTDTRHALPPLYYGSDNNYNNSSSNDSNNNNRRVNSTVPSAGHVNASNRVPHTVSPHRNFSTPATNQPSSQAAIFRTATTKQHPRQFPKQDQDYQDHYRLHDDSDDLDDPEDYDDDDDEEEEDEDEDHTSFSSLACLYLDPNFWLLLDAKIDNSGNFYFDSDAWTFTTWLRSWFYNPINPEFTSLQQFNWAVIIGVAMGIFVSIWKWAIEVGVDLMWESIPNTLLEWGVFTSLDGSFPLYYYVWICPAFWGGLLAWLTAISPTKIPDQNEWIASVHSRGVQDPSAFVQLWVLSTLAMMSGLSLGPELPLVLTGGMAGSWFGVLCKQSILQARVLNFTAAGAAVGGFFGFPMAGALFVLEIPHRMGLQYFEALSPATISSIVAVLCNRLITGNDVTGYFSYPFLSKELPSEIFSSAIVYGLYGAIVGYIYAKGCIYLKNEVHLWFHAPDDFYESREPKQSVVTSQTKKSIVLDGASDDEITPLVVAGDKKYPATKVSTASEMTPYRLSWVERIRGCGCLFIQSKPKRAAVAGVMAGAICGVIGMFVPHTMFWGEAQLQNLIDRGRTPLPVFGQGTESTAAMTALGCCMIDPNDPIAIKEGFDIGCSLLISVAKIVTIGLSLGTGIIGGHFWGPLFVGCSASHLFTDVVNKVADTIGVGRQLAAYPCVVILCTMGSAHVVTYRAHISIMLILTLTISAFNPENDTSSNVGVAGDYSAVFPLLVVSVFVALMTTKSFIFYKMQRSRGDITAVPEVLCEPGMEGRVAIIDYIDENEDLSPYDDDKEGHAIVVDDQERIYDTADDANSGRRDTAELTQDDIEMQFQARQSSLGLSNNVGCESPMLSSKRLDELLKKPLDDSLGKPKRHRRIHSEPAITPPNFAVKSSSLPFSTIEPRNVTPPRERSNSRGNLVRISSFGEVKEHQPSLLDQARMRSANSAAESRHRRAASVSGAPLSMSRHRRGASTSGTAEPRRPPSLPLGQSMSRGNSSSNLADLAKHGMVTYPSETLPVATDAHTFNSVSNEEFLDAMRKSFQ